MIAQQAMLMCKRCHASTKKVVHKVHTSSLLTHYKVDVVVLTYKAIVRLDNQPTRFYASAASKVHRIESMSLIRKHENMQLVRTSCMRGSLDDSTSCMLLIVKSS
jgi:hypothetical protein